MAILRKIIYLLGAVLTASCSEEIDVDIEGTPVLCLNTIIEPGSPIDVSVTRTWLYTDTTAWKDHGVDDAEVYIYANGELKEQDYLPKEGDEIRIKAQSRKYGDAEATVRVPERIHVTLDNLNLQEIQAFNTSSPEWPISLSVDFRLRAHIAVQDPPGKETFYRFSSRALCPDIEPEENPDLPWYDQDHIYCSANGVDTDAEPIFGEHCGVWEYAVGDAGSSYLFFTDRQFEGKQYTLNIYIDHIDYIFQWHEYDEEVFDAKIEFKVASISPSYYKYLLRDYRADDGMLEDLGNYGFGNPIWGYSNVSTGAGLVAARTVTTMEVPLRDFIKKLYGESRR